MYMTFSWCVQFINFARTKFYVNTNKTLIFCMYGLYVIVILYVYNLRKCNFMIRYLRTVKKIAASWDASIYRYLHGWLTSHYPLSTYHALGGVSRALRPTNLQHRYRHEWLGTILCAMATFENDTFFSERDKVHGQWNASWKNNRDTCSDLPQWSIIICKLEPFGIWAWQNITMVELCQTGQNLAITIKRRGKDRNRLICSS